MITTPPSAIPRMLVPSRESMDPHPHFQPRHQVQGLDRHRQPQQQQQLPQHHSQCLALQHKLRVLGASLALANEQRICELNRYPASNTTSTSTSSSYPSTGAGFATGSGLDQGQGDRYGHDPNLGATPHGRRPLTSNPGAMHRPGHTRSEPPLEPEAKQYPAPACSGTNQGLIRTGTASRGAVVGRGWSPRSGSGVGGEGSEVQEKRILFRGIVSAKSSTRL
ncbi:hypothetical protein I317_06499 [Kwoniella heveanensis CBS 569]|uniref:Uncharacterized protein n=1 Tax=Kwoniella heveanensis BCC8398 TaxID=1296120 RepID=A0A1B9H230_9TREE|nr:hypothetical protein I316_01224 [Kwoniella heveanensis BCC8398]OCF39706.1 hypothetical protein I317_06499 [Kwoniella heveanensis CBS 569]